MWGISPVPNTLANPCNDSSEDAPFFSGSSPENTSLLQGMFSQNNLFYLLVLVCIATAISLTLLVLDNVGAKDEAPNRRIHFSVLFDHNIRKVFKSQREDSLNTMLYGVRAALSVHCERPPVLMFLSNKNSSCTALSIAKRLTLAFLVAQGSEVATEKLRKVVMRGSKYQALEDYWGFYRGLSKRLAQLKVAIVSEFQCLHPQVASVLCNLADDAFSPYPKTMILLLVDVDNYFTERELQTRAVMGLAETFTNHIMSGFLDRDVVADLQRAICGRPALIEPDLDLELI